MRSYLVGFYRNECFAQAFVLRLVLPHISRGEVFLKMIVRRNDSRRRRSIVSEPTVANNEATEISATAEKKKSKRDASLYAFGANRSSQLKTTDFIPKRVFAVSVFVMVLVVIVGALNVLSIYASSWKPLIGNDGVAALALSGTGTLAAWFNSVFLLLASLACLQLFRLRKHRRDDYHGSYRMWMLMSTACLIGSLEAGTHISKILWPLAQSLTGISFQPSSWLPIAISASFLTLLFARTAFEVRKSRASLALTALACLAMIAVSVIQLPAISPAVAKFGGEILLGNCSLFAIVCVLMATVIDARFVFLEAHGLIKPNQQSILRKQEKREKAAAKKAAIADAKRKQELERQSALETKAAAKAAAQLAAQEAKAAKAAEAAAKANTKANAKKENQNFEVQKDNKSMTASDSQSAATKSTKTKSNDFGTSPLKSKMKSTTKANVASDDDADDHEGILNISKAQLRQQRKQEQRQKKSTRRAA